MPEPEEGDLEFEGGHWLVFIDGLWNGLGTVYPKLASMLVGVDESDPGLVQGILDEYEARGGEASPVATPERFDPSELPNAAFTTTGTPEPPGEEAQGEQPKPFWWNDQIEQGFKPFNEMGWEQDKNGKYTRWTANQMARDLRDARVYAEAFGIPTKKPVEAKPRSLSQQIEDALATGNTAEAKRLRLQQVDLAKVGKEEEEEETGAFIRGEDLPGGGPPGTFWIRQPSGNLVQWKPPEDEEALTFDKKLALMMGDAFGLPFDSPQWQAISLAIETRDQAMSKGGLSFAEAVRLAATLEVSPNETERFISMLTNPLGQRATPPAAAPPGAYIEPETYAPGRVAPAPGAQPAFVPLERARQLQPSNFPTPGEGGIAGQGAFAAGAVAGPAVPFADIPDEALSPDELRQKQEAQARLATSQVAFFPTPPSKASVGVQFGPDGEPIPTPSGAGLLAPPVPNPPTDTRLVDQSLSGQRAALASLRNRMPTTDFQALMARAAKGEQISPTSFPGPFIPAALAREFQYTSPEEARRAEVEAGTQAFQAAVAKGEPEDQVRARFNRAGGNVQAFTAGLTKPPKTPEQEALEEIAKQRQRQRKQQAFVASGVPRVRFA